MVLRSLLKLDWLARELQLLGRADLPSFGREGRVEMGCWEGWCTQVGVGVSCGCLCQGALFCARLRLRLSYEVQR